jgi:hypothetical protein
MIHVLNNLQTSFQAPLAAMLALASQGALSLFYVGWFSSVPFIMFSIIEGIQKGGGAGLIQTLGLRIVILAATLALVTAWPHFAKGVQADIENFSAAMAGTAGAPVNFTPDGVLDAFSTAGDIIKHSGEGGMFKVLDEMNPWKIVSIGIIELAGVGSAIMLLLANISFALVLAIGSVCIGFVSSPWLKGFLDQFIRVIVGAGIFSFGVAVFVGIGTTFAANIAGTTVVSLAKPMPGQDMLALSADVFFAFVLSALVPTAIAGRIAGGGILTGISEMLAFMRGRF